MLRRLLIAAAAAVASLAGCSGIKPPSIEVVQATVVETSDQAIALAFELDLTNPNPSPLRLREIDYTGRLNGADFTGRRAAELTLPASGRERISIPASFPFAQMPADAPRSGEIEYDVRGSVVYVAPQRLAEILLDTQIYRPKSRFSDAGTVLAP